MASGRVPKTVRTFNGMGYLTESLSLSVNLRAMPQWFAGLIDLNRDALAS
jgi:hypothetical protein